MPGRAHKVYRDTHTRSKRVRCYHPVPYMWDYRVPPLDWSRENYHKFKLAAYARGISAMEYMRQLMSQAIAEHEQAK